MWNGFARLCVLCVAICAASGPALAAKRVALVIGNSAYLHATPLKNPKNDANALAETLRRLEFEVIKGVDLKQLEFEGLVRKFARVVRGADVALLFYAGHGLQVNGRNYLAPVDARLTDEADLDFETLPLGTILKQMERETRTNLVFLDACRDNPLARNLARGMGTRSAGVGRGLARVETGIGTLIAFATEPGNVALDGSGGNSPFTEALLKHIETPGLDVDLMLRRVRKEVLSTTSGQQVPWSNSSLTGRFEFVARQVTAAPSAPEDHATRPAPPPRVDNTAIELAFWETIKNSDDVADYEGYLRRFPDGVFAGIAKRRLELHHSRQAALTPPETPAAAKKSIRLPVRLARYPNAEPSRAWLGVRIANVSGLLESCWGLSGHKGAFISDVTAGGPAKAAGLRRGDIVQKLDGKPVGAMQDLVRLVAKEPIGVTVQLDILRTDATTEGLKRLLTRGKANDEQALYCLGMLHKKGYGLDLDQTQALDWLRKAADAGSSNAMVEVGLAYEGGSGTGKDVSEANRWYRKAAEAGNPIGMTNLGYNLDAGNGIAKDAREANRLYRKAAESGTPQPRAMYLLGVNLEEGDGIPKDATEANRWHRKAAETGYLLAMNRLAYNINHGIGARKDAAEAIRWFRKAAEAGSDLGMFNLGTHYRDGQGVKRDHREAYKWFSKSAAKGNSHAFYSLAQAHIMKWGTEKSATKAADYMFKSIKGGNDFAIKQMTTNSAAWGLEFRRELQRLMKQDGVYAGTLDGQFGPATKRAIKSLAKK